MVEIKEKGEIIKKEVVKSYLFLVNKSLSGKSTYASTWF